MPRGWSRAVSALISITLPSLYRLSANCPPPISVSAALWSGTIDAPTGHSPPVSPPSHLAQSRFPTCRQPLKLPRQPPAPTRHGPPAPPLRPPRSVPGGPTTGWGTYTRACGAQNFRVAPTGMDVAVLSRATKPAAPRLGRADGPVVDGVAMTSLGKVKQTRWRSS